MLGARREVEAAERPARSGRAIRASALAAIVSLHGFLFYAITRSGPASGPSAERSASRIEARAPQAQHGSEIPFGTVPTHAPVICAIAPIHVWPGESARTWSPQRASPMGLAESVGLTASDKNAGACKRRTET